MVENAKKSRETATKIFPAEAEDTDRSQKIIFTVVLLTCVALFSTLFAFANDRRLLKNTIIDNK